MAKAVPAEGYSGPAAGGVERLEGKVVEVEYSFPGGDGRVLLRRGVVSGGVVYIPKEMTAAMAAKDRSDVDVLVMVPVPFDCPLLEMRGVGAAANRLERQALKWVNESDPAPGGVPVVYSEAPDPDAVKVLQY